MELVGDILSGLKVVLTVLGSLAIFLYGMKVMSDGLQKAAGNRLQNTLDFMTKNRFAGVTTGAGVTALIQSSSATTVMVVSFANAGLITLKQSIGVIMGANIGTTVTAWLVSIASVVDKFNILEFNIILLAFMLPLMFSKKTTLKNSAEAVIGLAIIFIGLHYIKTALPNIKGNEVVESFLGSISGDSFRWFHLLLFVAIGTGLTVIVQSSSAVTAVAIALVVQGILPFQPVAALVIGSNLGTTVTAMFASVGANTNAKRASMAHVLFNVAGAVWVIILFIPFVKLVEISAGPISNLLSANISQFTDFINNGTISEVLVDNSKVILSQTDKLKASINGATESEIVKNAYDFIVQKRATIQVSVFHTLFNVINTVLMIGFVPWFAKLVEKIVPLKEGEIEGKYHLKYISTALQDTPQINIQNAKAEIMKMTEITNKMFSLFTEIFSNPDKNMSDRVKKLKQKEDYTDQMQEEISRFLADCAKENLNDESRHNVNSMIRITQELESIGDSCFNLGILTQKKYDSKIEFSQVSCDQLNPFISITRSFLQFIQKHMNEHISNEELKQALVLEEKIDAMRSTLRRDARKRIQDGSNVKAELLYMDIVKHIEHIGDNALNIAQSLRAIK